MKKIKLCIEELRVDGFGTGVQSGERGTIRAHDSMDDSIEPYEPFPTGDGSSCSISQIEAETYASNAKAQAQRHQMQMETDNRA
jgi:hypothetical protein